MNTDNRGSVYSLWMEELLDRYIQILDDIISILRRIPRFPDHITEVDIHKLTIVLKAMGLNKEDYGDLGDMNNFMRAKGDAYNRALEKVEKWLKPEDLSYKGMQEIVRKMKNMENEEEQEYDDIFSAVQME